MKHFRYILLVLILLPFNSFAATKQLPDFTQLVKRYSPSVVNISTTRHIQENPMDPFSGLDDVPPAFQDMFRHFFDDRHLQMQPHKVRSLGSGVIVSSDGYVLTNDHVIHGADQIIVRLNDKREFPAKVIGEDKGSDLALLKIDAKGLQAIVFGDSNDLQVGEWVLAIGSPFGFDHSVTAGIVSAKGRNLQNERYIPFIQTDVAINPGNSGGPLLNLNGEVIGINAQIISRSGGYLGLSFAVPSNVAKRVIPQLKDRGYVKRGWLGVSFQVITRELAESFGLSQAKGALVAKVVKDGPADKAGLKPGDIITRFNNQPIDEAFELPALVGQTKAGTRVPVEVLRRNRVQRLTVKLGDLPDEGREKPRATQKAKSGNVLGVQIRELTKEERKHGPGVMIVKIKNGPALENGLRPGDVLIAINMIPIDSVRTFEKVTAKLPKNKPFPVLARYRDNNEHYISMSIKD